MKYLYPYECAKNKLSSPAELQAAIDGNRRDSRRSFGSFLSQSVPSDGTHAYSNSSPSTTPPSFTANHSHSPAVTQLRSSPGPSVSGNEVRFEIVKEQDAWRLLRGMSRCKHIKLLMRRNNHILFALTNKFVTRRLLLALKLHRGRCGI